MVRLPDLVTHACKIHSFSSQESECSASSDGPGITNVSWQEVYLADCGSTHGTFMGKRRFEAGIPYTVGNGEVITFGQRVTSGASELTALSIF